MRKTARSACNTCASRFQRLVVVKAHVASDCDDGIQCNAVLFFDVHRERTQEGHVLVIVCCTRLAHDRVTELRFLVGAIDAEGRNLAMCRSVRKHGTQHYAHLRCHGIVEHGLRFHLVPEDDSSVAVPDFLDKAGFCPVGVLALENLAREDCLVGRADFGNRNVVHAERHAEHFLQFLADADFFCKSRIVCHGKRTAVIRPVAQMFHVKVICVAVNRFNHRVQTLEIGEREVVYKLYGVERLELCGFIRVQFLDFAGTPNFGITLEVVVYVFGEFRVSLRLFYADVVERSVTEVLHGVCTEFLAVVHVALYECVASLSEFDFTLGLVFHHEPELVAQRMRSSPASRANPFLRATSSNSLSESLSKRCSKSQMLAMFSERVAAQAILTMSPLFLWSGRGK